MNARRPKPTALKEKSSDQARLGLSRLFAAANALVSAEPRAQTQTHDDLELGRAETVAVQVSQPLAKAYATSLDDDRTMKLVQPERTSAASVVRDETTSPRTRRRTLNQASETLTRTKPSDPVRAHTSLTKIKAQHSQTTQTKPRKQDRSSVVFACFTAAALALIYLVLSPSASDHGVRAKSHLTDAQIQERLDYHRSLTGSHLNRERIDVQIQNHMQAPQLGADDQKIKAPDMMSGLPLQGERANSPRAQAKLPVNSTHPDARIMYGLQEEQDRIEFEKKSEAAWVEEFKQNALKDGYEVQIDQFGNVKSRKLTPEERGFIEEPGETPDGL